MASSKRKKKYCSSNNYDYVDDICNQINENYEINQINHRNNNSDNNNETDITIQTVRSSDYQLFN